MRPSSDPGPAVRPQVWTIVVAAGSGTRFGAAKQFAPLGAATVLDRSVATALAASDGVVVVLAPGAAWAAPPGVTTVEGGAQRSDSVRRGLGAVPDGAGVILVHDAARPLATRELYAAAVAAVHAGADAVIPAVPVADTLKRVDDAQHVVATVARDHLVAAQTPQAFRASVLRAVHAGAPDATDDAGLVEAAGGTVVVVPGDATNFKITTPSDLVLAEALVRAHDDVQGDSPGDAPGGAGVPR